MSHLFTPSTPSKLHPQRPLNELQGELLLKGNTLYIDVGEERPAIIHYGENGEVTVRHASGKRDQGRWKLAIDGTYCVDWVLGPKNSCSEIRWAPGDLRIFSLTGEYRGRIMRIEPGKVSELE